MIRRELSIALQTDKTPAQYVELAQLVDGYGFDALTVYGDLPFHPSFGPLLLMAPHVRRARLGPAGVSPSRMSPVDIAASAALLALATPGGAYLGLVRGAWLAEHGIREPDDPIRAIRETIEIVRALHTGACTRARRAAMRGRSTGSPGTSAHPTRCLSSLCLS